MTATHRARLRLDGDPVVTDRIRDDAQLVLEGGIFDANGRSETLGALSIFHVDSIIDFGEFAEGSTAQILRFAASHELSWTGSLKIWNWNGESAGGGLDQIYFGLALGHLRPDQLAMISFYSDEGESFLGAASQLVTGEIVPAIPEPSGAALLLWGVWLAGCRRWTVQRCC